MIGSSYNVHHNEKTEWSKNSVQQLHVNYTE
jgi:hypothetical protein